MAATSPLGTINPAVLNALTLKYNRDTSNLDLQQNRQRLNYTSALDKMRRGYQDTELKSREGLSDRGMFHSGPAVARATKLQDEYNRQQGEANQLNQLNLGAIARNRLLTKQEFDNNKILASLGLSAS